jgi:hypothetical protein
MKTTKTTKKIAPSVRKMFAEVTKGEKILPRVSTLALVDGRTLAVDTLTVDDAGRLQVLTTDGRCMQVFPREVA